MTMPNIDWDRVCLCVFHVSFQFVIKILTSIVRDDNDDLDGCVMTVYKKKKNNM